MVKIEKCKAKEILDARGNKALQVTLQSSTGKIARSKVSYGEGEHRGVLWQKNNNIGGVEAAIVKVNTIVSPALVGIEIAKAEDADNLLSQLDGTNGENTLGDNAMIGVSMAVARLFAQYFNLPLWEYIAGKNETELGMPRFFVRMLAGGSRGDHRLPFEEYSVVLGHKIRNGADSLDTAHDVFRKLGDAFEKDDVEATSGVGGEYSPLLSGVETPIEYLARAIRHTDDATISVNISASTLWKGKSYRVATTEHSWSGLMEMYRNLHSKFPFRGIENAFREEEHEAFEKALVLLGRDTVITSGVVTPANFEATKDQVKNGEINTIVIEPSKAQTLTLVYEAMQFAEKNNCMVLMSPGGGDLADDFSADLAYGLGTYGIKLGTPRDGENMIHHNRLLEIERER